MGQAIRLSKYGVAGASPIFHFHHFQSPHPGPNFEKLQAPPSVELVQGPFDNASSVYPLVDRSWSTTHIRAFPQLPKE